MVEDWEPDEDTVPCPYCREPVYEDAPRCPHCGEYISKEDAPSSRKPPWIIMGLVLCLITAALWVAGR